jgi:hypothetical protein
MHHEAREASCVTMLDGKGIASWMREQLWLL